MPGRGSRGNWNYKLVPGTVPGTIYENTVYICENIW